MKIDITELLTKAAARTVIAARQLPSLAKQAKAAIEEEIKKQEAK